jgi:hypothetical protein
MASFPEVAKVLGITAARYPQFALTEATIKAYAPLLVDIDAQALMLACNQHAAESKWFPSVAEIREKAQAMTTTADGRPDAGGAWRELADALKIGASGPEWRTARENLHPAVVEAAEQFGFDRFVMRMTENAGTDFAQFRSIYETVCKRRDSEQRMLPEVRAYVAQLGDAMRAERKALPAADAAPGLFVARPARPAEPVAAASTARAEAMAAMREIATRRTPSREKLEREAQAARLRASIDRLTGAIAGETDEAKRRAMQLQLDGQRKALTLTGVSL